MMYLSNEAMFGDFDLNGTDIVSRVSKYYDTHPDFVRPYIEHLKHSQRENPRAFAGFESEMSAFQHAEELVIEMKKDFNISFEGARVLDVGCAAGHTIRALLKNGAGSVLGIELSQPRASSGDQNLQLYGIEPCIKVGSILDPRLVEDLGNCFDYVILFDVLEHVPSIDQTLVVVRSLLKPGGKVIIRSGNPYNPEFLQREPHYGLPGMTLLDRDSALEYHAAHFEGEYEVFEWLCRDEIEARLSRSHFDPLPSHDVPTLALTEFDAAFEVLAGCTYPNQAIRQSVLNALKLLWVMRRAARDPHKIFCVSNYLIIAEAV